MSGLLAAIIFSEFREVKQVSNMVQFRAFVLAIDPESMWVRLDSPFQKPILR
jgi:hypothetical protein